MTSKLLSVLICLFLTPAFFIYGLGVQFGRDVDDKKTLTVALIMALLNAAFIWWLIYEAFIK